MNCWMAVAITIMVIALLVSGARLLLPYMNTFHQQIEERISQAVGATVEVRSLDASWHGAGPQLKLRGVRVLSGEMELLNFESGRIGLNLLQSLYHRSWQLGDLVVTGVELEIMRDEAGKISVTGFAVDTSNDLNDEQIEHRATDELALLSWLFSQPRMMVESSEINWRDMMLDGRELRFTNVDFELRSQAGRHQLSGEAELPVHLGRTLSFALDIEGDLEDVNDDWEVLGYVEGGELQIAQWLEGREPSGVRIDDGQVETRLWFEWRDDAIQRVDGELSLRQLLLTPLQGAIDGDSRDPMRIDLVSGAYAWQRNALGWSFSINDFMLGRENRMWPPSQLSVAALGGPGDELVIEAKLGYAQIDDLKSLLVMSDAIDESLRSQLRLFAPGGVLRDVYFHYRRGFVGEEKRYVLSSQFENIGMTAQGTLPGGQGFDGAISLDNSGGVLLLNSKDVTLSMPKLFRGPLAVNTLQGDLYWQLNEQGWQLESRSLQLQNSDVELLLDLALKKGESAPEIALLAEFEAASVANVSHYLPVGIMSDALIKWLDQAVVNGNVSAGQAIFYGPLNRDFPYDKSDGLFDIRFNLTDGILDYASEWPRLEEIEAELIFAGSGMEINAVAAKSLDADVMQVSVRIEDFRAHPVLLEIDGQAQGRSYDALDFVKRSPLHELFGDFVDEVEVVAGRSKLDLSLKLPLADQPAKVAGVVQFDAADIYFSARAVDILNVNGALQFSEKGIEIKQAKARLLGMDSTLNAQTMLPSKGGATIITAVGTASSADVQRLVDISLLQHIDGESQWQAKLTIPAKDIATVGVSLQVTSDLKGMASHLPYPLAKQASQSDPFMFETVFPHSLNVPLRLQVGSQLHAVLDLGERMDVQRGAITFGDVPLEMPKKEVISLGGKLDHLLLDDWVPFLNGVDSDANASHSSAVESGGGIGLLNLEIAELTAFGYDFHHASLNLAQTPIHWQGQISSHLIGGEVKIPLDFKRGTLVMALDYLILPVIDQGMQGGDQNLHDDVDPRQLPAMDIQSQFINYAGQRYDQLKLLTTRTSTGMHVEQFMLQSSWLNLSARGDWQMVNSERYSSFNISVNSGNFGKMLSMFEIADSIRDGESEINIVARWPGSPMAFALEQLSGNMQLNVEDGRLLDIEPGAGRLFGLLSVQALPRRLTLDFSDMFKKGFSFDRMAGDFEINAGDATTSNFNIVGPSASIKVVGRVGLIAKDYDQQVTVEPHVGSSLPVVGAVVSSLGTGLVIWAAQKLLKLDEVTQVKYRITGPWEAPMVLREDEIVPEPAEQQ
ncbi:FIG005080: Possible exported protein [hydrothermal vent metagenome]|uniref:FIG005080: Possible exported protein n=1 Tax=hydrothermal vent metagenome TaxID=652676 RepID=A0A3B1A8G8_9ZZZZ